MVWDCKKDPNQLFLSAQALGSKLFLAEIESCSCRCVAWGRQKRRIWGSTTNLESQSWYRVLHKEATACAIYPIGWKEKRPFHVAREGTMHGQVRKVACCILITCWRSTIYKRSKHIKAAWGRSTLPLGERKSELKMFLLTWSSLFHLWVSHTWGVLSRSPCLAMICWLCWLLTILSIMFARDHIASGWAFVCETLKHDISSGWHCVCVRMSTTLTTG